MNALENPPEEIEESQDPPFPTPEISQKILAALGCGVMRYDAACIAGINPITLGAWLNSKIPECIAFREAVIRKEHLFTAQAFSGMAKAGIKDWRAYPALLQLRLFTSRGQMSDYHFNGLSSVTYERIKQFGLEGMLEDDLYPTIREEKSPF